MKNPPASNRTAKGHHADDGRATSLGPTDNKTITKPVKSIKKYNDGIPAALKPTDNKTITKSIKPVKKPATVKSPKPVSLAPRVRQTLSEVTEEDYAKAAALNLRRCSKDRRWRHLDDFDEDSVSCRGCVATVARSRANSKAKKLTAAEKASQG